MWRLSLPAGLWASLSSTLHCATGRPAATSLFYAALREKSVEKSLKMSIMAPFWPERTTLGHSLHVFLSQAPPFVTSFIEELNRAVEAHKPGHGLSSTQRGWISFCIMGVLVTNSVCWARFERAGLGRYSMAALCWVFHHAKISWDFLLLSSVRVILARYGITEGCLLIDDTDKKRSKSTRKIAYVHKLKDKASGGFVMGQQIVFLVLATAKITFPVGFAFYMPDPALSQWNRRRKQLKKAGIKIAAPKPRPNANYPSKQQIGLGLLAQFRQNHPEVRVRCIVADALYGSGDFVREASLTFEGVQVISQLKADQNLRFKSKLLTVEDFFAKYASTVETLPIRGGQLVRVTVASARLHVCAHGTKRFVIALKYEGEEQYRYLVASDLSWTTQDILKAHTLRWLVEVFHEDWKSYEGWGQLTKQQGEEGSSKSLILSLLTDHCLLLHPEQTARIENNLPACTVGSLQATVRVDALFDLIRQLLASEDPKEMLGQLSHRVKELFVLQPSKKHMVGRDLGRLQPSPSLKYKAAKAA